MSPDGFGSLFNVAAFVVAMVVASSSSLVADDATDLAALIDRHIVSHWRANQIVPARRSSDAEFMRRAWLDLCGRIPTAGQAREFLEDTRADKRRRLIDDLLDRGAFVGHFTRTLRNAWLPAQDTDRYPTYATQFDNFLRDRLRKDVPYDQIVREILTSPTENSAARTTPDNQQGWPRSLGFFEANERKPDLIAANAAKAFLGVRIDCAQCHDHPFGAWKREQFWQFAAFFSDDRTGQEPSITVPDRDTVVRARFLSGESPTWDSQDGPDETQARAVLANWITSPDNAYFAKAAVNRMWAHCFGVGLIEPVDDMISSKPPSHPELLDDLARAFLEHDYDLKYLLRGILRSQAYSLTGRCSDDSQDNPFDFARMAVKPLTGEQLLDSVVRAAGYGSAGPLNGSRPFTTVRAEFLVKFASTAQSIEVTTSIPQALTRMNGALTTLVTDISSSPLLVVLRDAPHFDHRQRIEEMFLASLSRRPTTDESQRLTDYVAAGGTQHDLGSALGDIFWVLLNSYEFSVNH